MTPREALFVRLVVDGMRRAYRAAEKAGESKLEIIEVWFPGIDPGDPCEELPDVTFIYQNPMSGAIVNVKVNLAATYNEMLRRAKWILTPLASPCTSVAAAAPTTRGDWCTRVNA
jgi:hypothetical protein